MHRRWQGRGLEGRRRRRRSRNTKGQGNTFQTHGQIHHTDFVAFLVIDVKVTHVVLGRDVDQGELGATDLGVLGKVVVVHDSQEEEFSVG